MRFTDRQSTKVVDTPQGKAVRYAKYDEDGNLIEKFYLVLDDEPTQKGVPLLSDNLHNLELDYREWQIIERSE